ncbi:TPA: hypothetical protein JLQ40_004945 [Escherichia coli]|uniref:hypothetical protein n=1 Tax=Escherichia coli TaxID=562 RepID=UPI000BE6AFA1|nr:hypothetical protein [Escherichia coli]DAG41394.1 MAG TPA: hypothetical protein [Caudoviricetes sp.]EHD1462261.1 hypothetical protein [Escherichia coli]EHO0043475.1 hypothetical protein [Escherichia coli]EKR5116959.1 hypothetical protein [Escherichia coli]DAG65671.1 MAG TPA: hypothetical protein [Caudoviricetes sp.]
MEKKEDKPMVIGAVAVPFKFELSQLVEMRISDEWGEVKARAQYADGENQYLIHYKAADGRATTAWFGESMLEATEDDRHPGCPVFAGMKLPEGAVELQPGEVFVMSEVIDGKPQYSRIETNGKDVCLVSK